MSTEAFLRLLYPSECGLCPALLDLRQDRLCPPCLESFLKEVLPSPQRRIRHKLEFLDKAWGAFQYGTAVRQVIRRIKFERRHSLLSLFKEAFRDTAQHMGRSYDMVVPIPASLSRRLQRHLNPPDVLAEEAALTLRIPIKRNILRKKSGVEAQSLLSREERLANLYGAFKIGPFTRVRNASILLVDDVFTTGSTADEAARVLKTHGAGKVDLLAAARASAEGETTKTRPDDKEI